MKWSLDTSFLEVVQQSDSKKDASISQLLCMEGEEVEELTDDYGYDEIIARRHDEELEDILGEELFHLFEQRVLLSHTPREELISFTNGLGFHLLDWIIVLETEFGIHSERFTTDMMKKMEKRLPRFPYIDKTRTIFDLTIREVMELLDNVTGGSFSAR